MNPFVRSAYNYDMNDASEESGLECLDPTLTQQSFKDEVDINTLVERFGLTGEMPQITKLPSFGDFTGVFDYQSAMNAVVAARETFDSLPAKIRARFQNNPHEFVNFVEDPDNEAEAIKLGIVETPPKAVEPQAKQGDTPKTPNVTQ